MAAPGPAAPPEQQPPPASVPPTPELQPPSQQAPPAQQPSPAEHKYQSPPAQQAPPPQGQPPQGQPPQPSTDPQHQQDHSFLPLVHDIIKCIDRDSQEVHQVLNELRTKFVEVRKLIKTMHGIGVSPEQQQQQLQSLRDQVRTKSELLQKYKTLCMFEIPKE